MADDTPPVEVSVGPLIVGIGASAGGLEPIEEFFGTLPANPDMAVVVVQHLSPNFKSMMDDLLAAHTSMPVRIIQDGMEVEKDSVFLIPPGKDLVVLDGRFRLQDQDRSGSVAFLPIDKFFRSLAAERRTRAVGIVLSGTGSDGSRGLQAINDAGGLSIAQDPMTAAFDGMPVRSIDAGAQLVLAPNEMYTVVEEFMADPDGLRRLRSSRADGFDGVMWELRAAFSVDFHEYKENTVERRILRRMQFQGLNDIRDYEELVRSDRAELDALYRDLLVGVTRFFRDPEAFAVLRERVIPQLLRDRDPGDPVR
ncbi:MAG: chemotaxis protein CheB, partial [Acidimicrobiia bacterium]|nr:chemotaxis protein CheB [Acidimicrobiia bacterium]